MSDSRAKVLCVDDESRVLEGLALHLHRHYEVTLATSGANALILLSREGPFAVVISDMRMPQMDGATFLGRVRLLAPDTVRMVLTGQAQIETAAAAINEGEIFRFLTKPCSADQLLKTTAAAVEQHRLLVAERVLLAQTLQGSIKVMTDVLALTNPVAFGRATRLKEHVADLLDILGTKERWQIDVAAMVSQLGCIILPPRTAESFFYGRVLTPQEQSLVTRIPAIAEQLLANIPRLEVVREILSNQTKPFRQLATSNPIATLGASILKVVIDFDVLEMQGVVGNHALAMMRGREGTYDPKIVHALAQLHQATASRFNPRDLPLDRVEVGMVLAEDVRTTTGLLLAARGYVVTAGFTERVGSLPVDETTKVIRVLVPIGPKA